MTNQSLTVHFTEVGPKQEKKKSPSVSMLGRHGCNNIVKQTLAGRQQPITNCKMLIGVWPRKRPPVFLRTLAKIPGPATPGELPEQCFLQVLHCQQRDVLSSQGTAAQCKQPLNGARAFYSALVWYKRNKKTHKKSPQLVFFCALQRQYFSGSKFKTHGLLGEAWQTMY